MALIRAGIGTPVLALSGNRPAWEHSAGIGEVREIAQNADKLGFEFLTCPDHVAVPPGLPRGSQFYDPLATFSYLAAVTNRIRFLPYVLVLPFYHPLELAKRYGTLDHLSNGRLILGLGVGNLKEEFDVLGVPFSDRGLRADDALRALRAAMGRNPVSYHGEYYAFDNLMIEPRATQEQLPLWIGGHTQRALRRAVTLADGWSPAPVQYRGPDYQMLKQMLGTRDLPAGFEVLVSPESALDPAAAPDQTLDSVHRAIACGATMLNVTFRHRSLAHYLEQLAAYSELTGLGAALRGPATEVSAAR